MPKNKLWKLSILFVLVWMHIGCTQCLPPSGSSSTGESLSKWSADAANVVRAEIISVDEKKQEVTIKDIVTGNVITTRVSDPSTLGSFVRGDRVRVTFGSSETAFATNVVIDEDWKK